MSDPRTLHRSWDPDTSIAAADAIVDRVTEIQIDVLAFAHQRGPAGFTDLELARHFGDFTSTYRTRRAELTRAGKIIDTGRRVRPPGRRRDFIVWAHVKTRSANDAVAPLGRAAGEP